MLYLELYYLAFLSFPMLQNGKINTQKESPTFKQSGVIDQPPQSDDLFFGCPSKTQKNLALFNSEIN